MLDSMVTRPKSSATVVVVFCWTCPGLSTPTAAVVMAASVVSGSISDKAPIAVVLPTPKPPEMTIFTGTGGGAGLERSDTEYQPFQEFDIVSEVARRRCRCAEQVRGEEVCDDHSHNADGQAQMRRDLGDRLPLRA
jgi:hypothetical protein